MKCDFSYQHYRQMIKAALGAGFIITNLRDYDKNKHKQKLILLRHDIDYSPKRAFEIAKIEKSLNVKSTYFIRVHGEHYQPFDKESYPTLLKILKMGHEIGLHLEARTMSKWLKVDMIDLFYAEKKALEAMFNIKVISASEHADLYRNEQNFWRNHFFTKVNKRKVRIKNFPQEKRFQKLHYLSDSSRFWREGCPCKNLTKFYKFQILTHPDHWGKGAIEEVRKKIRDIGLKPTY